MQTIYIILTIFKGLIIVGGITLAIYFLFKKNTKRALIAFFGTFGLVILLTGIEFLIAVY